MYGYKYIEIHIYIHTGYTGWLMMYNVTMRGLHNEKAQYLLQAPAAPPQPNVA